MFVAVHTPYHQQLELTVCVIYLCPSILEIFISESHYNHWCCIPAAWTSLHEHF